MITLTQLDTSIANVRGFARHYALSEPILVSEPLYAAFYVSDVVIVAYAGIEANVATTSIYPANPKGTLMSNAPMFFVNGVHDHALAIEKMGWKLLP